MKKVIVIHGWSKYKSWSGTFEDEYTDFDKSFFDSGLSNNIYTKVKNNVTNIESKVCPGSGFHFHKDKIGCLPKIVLGGFKL